MFSTFEYYLSPYTGGLQIVFDNLAGYQQSKRKLISSPSVAYFLNSYRNNKGVLSFSNTASVFCLNLCLNK